MSRKSEAMALVQDIVVALVVVAVVLGSLYVYGGRWPPMVVVESESMQHDDELSYIGVIDTGDLTLVRTLDNAGAPRTWVEGRDGDHRTYGEFGDVIIYHKNGQTQTTPIIHRAVVRIEYDAVSEAFDVPSLDLEDVTGSFYVEDFHRYHNGRRRVERSSGLHRLLHRLERVLGKSILHGREIEDVARPDLAQWARRRSGRHLGSVGDFVDGLLTNLVTAHDVLSVIRSLDCHRSTQRRAATFPPHGPRVSVL